VSTFTHAVLAVEYYILSLEVRLNSGVFQTQGSIEDTILEVNGSYDGIV
jgi:hypothetical protein